MCELMNIGNNATLLQLIVFFEVNINYNKRSFDGRLHGRSDRPWKIQLDQI